MRLWNKLEESADSDGIGNIDLQPKPTRVFQQICVLSCGQQRESLVMTSKPIIFAVRCS